MHAFTEIHDFKLDNYLPHIGWIGAYTTCKIYSKEGSQNYFLHDERTDRLFEFSTGGEKLKSREQADRVIAAYNL
ncbi:hypothetical protein [Dyadobacter sp. CY323]|uniref:hypothetical protein n=1 Tax=Dyadobacter sp. CY323 TaxID=2907302 RepID=UPI001F244C23|nr:hypothetical protein [Dyadobacter sp. CY323]MCE6993078.1 hypothetical protein [Dyadobacter sp. CY323]